MAYLGIIFALVAALTWGFGDFFIQRTSRKIGIINALFYVSALATVVLLPFVWPELEQLASHPKLFGLLLLAGVVVCIAAVIQYEALKEGKLSVIEPIISFEMPLTVLLGVSVAGEYISVSQALLILVVFIGIILSSTTNYIQLHYHRRLFERGVLFAALGAVGMAVTNFLIGYSSQETSPLLTIWFTQTVIVILCVIYLVIRKQLSSLVTDLKLSFRLIALESIFDNIAWISYAFAVIFIPISIAITISESYIVLAVLLGLWLNKEKLKRHQYLGIVITIIGVIVLAAISNY